MSLKRLANWLLTPAGRNAVLVAAGTASLGAFFTHALPNTIFIDKYREIVQFYEAGFAVPVSKTLNDRFEKALDLAEVADEDRPLFRPFNVFGFDVFSAGTSYSKFGCIVGLPTNFGYKDVDSIKKQDIKIRETSVSWGLDEGKQLLHALVLSENAQLYAMAREIKMLQSPKPILDAFYSTGAVVMAYGLGLFFNTRLNLYARPLFVRSAMYCLVGAFVGGNYFLAKDFSQVYYEKKIDEELKNKDPRLREGGLEFYNQILERNKALRKLMEKEGEYNFSAMGNENYLVRQKHLPLVHRRDFFAEKQEGETL